MKTVLKVEQVNARIMFMKLLVGKVILVVISTYALQADLSEDVNGIFFVFNERKTVVFSGDLNGCVGKHVQWYESAHGGHGYCVRNAEGSLSFSVPTIGEVKLSYLCVAFSPAHQSGL